MPIFDLNYSNYDHKSTPLTHNHQFYLHNCLRNQPLINISHNNKFHNN